MIALKYILLIVCSYLLGSVNFARILSKNVMHGDITKSGSGNPGTMNMLRTYGFKAGALTLVLDALKGVIPALVGYFLFGGDGSNAAYVGLYVGGLSAVVGHCFPVFYKFRRFCSCKANCRVNILCCCLYISLHFRLCFYCQFHFYNGTNNN